MNNFQPFIKRYFVAGVHYYQNFDFVFSNQTNILVGQSGLGKTKILQLLYLTLTQRWATLSKLQFDFISIEFREGKTVEFSKGELEFYLLISYETSDFGNKKIDILKKFANIINILNTKVRASIIYFPVYRDLIDDLAVIGKDYSQTKFPGNFMPMEYFEATNIERDVLIPTQLEDLIVGGNNYDMQRKLSSLVNICNSYLLGIKLHIDSNLKIYINNVTTNESVDLTQLSSGEKQLIYFFFKIFFAKSDSTCVLFDEPELSIPIDWQRRLFLDLRNIKEDMFLLAITHSPFIFDNELDQFANGINVYKI